MIEQVSPYIRLAWYDVLPADGYVQERVIFDYELFYIKSGKATVTVENTVYEGQQGDIFIFRPKQRHSIRIMENKPLVQPHIHFDLLYYPDRKEVPISFKALDKMTADETRWFREDILDEYFSPFPSRIRPKSPLYIEQLIFDIIHAYKNPTPFYEVSLKWMFMRLWEQLLSEITYESDRANLKKAEAVYIVKLYIEQNVNRRLTLDELADTHNFSKSYLSRLFKDTYKTSPLHYHTMLRVQKAKHLIYYTNMPLSEIALLLNFENPQDFSRVFKKIEGVPPSHYRLIREVADMDLRKPREACGPQWPDGVLEEAAWKEPYLRDAMKPSN